MPPRPRWRPSGHAHRVASRLPRAGVALPGGRLAGRAFAVVALLALAVVGWQLLQRSPAQPDAGVTLAALDVGDARGATGPGASAGAGALGGPAALGGAVALAVATAGPTGDPSPSPTAMPTGYRWPVDHARITTAYGPNADGLFLVDGQRFHDGLDLATFCGDRIEAAHDGVVLVAGRRVNAWLGWVGGFAAYEARLDTKHLWGSVAIMVVIDDGDGYRSVYVHLARAIVKTGQRVRAGELIGYEGATGDASGCHLHYSLFSPTETSTFETDPKQVERTSLPPGELARIDPLLVLPPLTTAGITWGWGARD